jgi:hypothetical protein
VTRLAAAALVVAVALGNVWFTLARSTIPLSFEGRVNRVELRREKRPGVDDVHLVHIDERVLQVDAVVAEHLREDYYASKRAWAAELVTSRGTLRLMTSAEFRRMVLLMQILAAVGIILVRSGPRPV